MSKTDYFEESAFAGLALDRCFVVDAHQHHGENASFPIADLSAETLVSAMDRIGVNIFCACYSPGILGCARIGNDAVIDLVNRYPGRAFGYMSVDIGYESRIVPEMERCLAAGLRAVKVWSYGVRTGLPYSHPNYELMCSFADAHGLPILAHTFSQEELQDLEVYFPKYPGVKFLLAHPGSIDRSLYASLASNYGNVYLETCFSAAPRGLIEYFVGAGLCDKVLWGSDAMYMSAEQQVGRVLFARISEEDKRKILGLNAVRVLGLDTGSAGV